MIRFAHVYDSLRSCVAGLMLCATVVTTSAQDTLRVSGDTLRVSGDTVWVQAENYAGTYEDTVFVSEMTEVADMDLYLLELVQQQSILLAEQEKARRDSIELDSLRRAYTELEDAHVETPMIVVNRSIVKDTEEDKLDLLRAIEFQKTRWRKEATVMAQITQNYVTDNWYQGGNSNFAMLALAKGQIGYYGDKFTWENTGEWREGFSTVSGDSLRKVNTTDDLLKLYSKAGYRVHSKLNVSFSAEYEMHFIPVFKSNEDKLKSGFASPMRYNMALGIDYKPVKGLSVVFSPIAYKMVFVGDTIRMKQTDFGVPVGSRVLNDAGSSIRLEYLWKPLREIALETKFYMYTNYTSVELDLEVNCDFIINRFLSARVMLHPRYESNVIREGDTHAKIQFKELLSIGFAHKFR